MADSTPKISSSFDPRSGFCSSTRIFHSLRLQSPLPESDMSVADYVFSLLKPQLSTSKSGLIDALSGDFVSYSQVLRRAEGLAAAVQRRIGLKRGDAAFVLSQNTADVPVVYLALLLLGVIVSPANPMSTRNEIARQIELCHPVIAFATSSTSQKLPKLKFGTLLTDSAEFNAMAMAEPERCGFANVSQGDPATILYSSGTTGKVKGVVLTHRNCIAMLAGMVAAKQARENEKLAVMCCTVPYFHIYGLLVMLRSVAFCESLVWMKRTDTEVMMRAVERYKVTHVAAAPPLVSALVRSVEVGRHRYDLSSLEVVASGGAPLREDTIVKFRRFFPNVQLAQAYGLTETTGGITRVMGVDESRVLGANGRLVPQCEAKIVDPDSGEALPPLKVGEIWFRGPTVMKGYVGDEEATRATIDSEGWLKTGDLGYFDEDGFLFFTDRIKELIKYNAYQVAPAELEHILHSHPDIIEAAVIPYPDEKAGQVPMAFIVKESNSNLTETEVMTFVADQVAPYKRVRRVSFIDSIPKGATGKVLRKELIKMALPPKVSKL